MKKECCNINEIVQEYYSYLKSYILKKVNDSSLADDLVQEVMIKLVESHQKSTEVKNMKAWLFQISRNVMYDYFKKNQMTYQFDTEHHAIEDTFSDSEKIIVSDFIVPMIDLLPVEYAKPLKMCDIDKISQKKISEELNIGLSATKMRIQRGRKKLRELFVECCEMKLDKNGNILSCSIKSSCNTLKEIKKDLKNSIS